MHVSIVTLSTKDSVNLAKQLSEGFKRSVYWNRYQTKPAEVIQKEKNLYELLNASFQGVRRLFVFAYVVAGVLRIMKQASKTINSIFFQEVKLIITTYWLMEEISTINQLMAW